MSWEPFKELTGQTIVAFSERDNGEQIAFRTAAGDWWVYYAEGDCCSSSWFEHISDPTQAMGSPVTEIREYDMELAPEQQHDKDCKHKGEARPAERDYSYLDGCYCESIQAYGFRIQTAKGGMDLEMHNSSNGYYGGSVEFQTKLDALPGDWSPKAENALFPVSETHRTTEGE